MKVIDLLNKIANGEEVPKEIILNDNVFIYDETDDNEVNRYRTMTDDFLIDEGYLNDEVEVIEEDKKIENIKELNSDYCDKQKTYDFLKNEEIVLDILTLKHKINEIIDKINEGD